MARRPQHGKGHKRKRSWHRGRGEARDWAATALPDVGTGADPTTATPVPLRRTGKTNRGDTA